MLQSFETPATKNRCLRHLAPVQASLSRLGSYRLLLAPTISYYPLQSATHRVAEPSSQTAWPRFLGEDNVVAMIADPPAAALHISYISVTYQLSKVMIADPPAAASRARQ